MNGSKPAVLQFPIMKASKINCRTDHGSLQRSLDGARDHAQKEERDKDPEVVQSYSGVVESSAEYGNG